MRYLDFRLQIVTGPADGYTVQAVSPRGEGKAYFVSPFPGNELGALKAALGSPFERHLTSKSAESPDYSPRAVGERLFEALLHGEILRLYERSLDLLGSDPEAGLR